MITQLNPTIPLETPKGRGYAHFIIDYGQEHNLIWVVFIDETHECWSFQNTEVRLQHNQTMTGNFNYSTIQQSQSEK